MILEEFGVIIVVIKAAKFHYVKKYYHIRRNRQ